MNIQEIAAQLLAARFNSGECATTQAVTEACAAAKQIQTELPVSGTATEFVKMQAQLKDIELEIRGCMSDPSNAIMQILRR